MKILHELNQLAMGGAERIVLSIAKFDKKNKHTVFSYKDGPMREVFEKAGVDVIIERPEGEEAPDMKVDVIHLHTGGNASHLAGTVRRSIATVETVHSPVVSAVRDEWVNARVGVTNAVTKLNRKCRTIYNGIDLSRLDVVIPDGEEDAKKYFKKQFNIPENAFVVGRLGRLGYDKGIEEWIAAAWEFQRSLPSEEEKPYFIICGDEFEPGYWATIKVMCASLPLKNVRFVEGCDNVAPVYAAMDVFMYPSPTEGFGLVVMEAMACGAAALVWDTQVMRELLMAHAHIVPATVDGLVSGLKLLKSNKALLDEFSDLGQALVLSDFTAERMSGQYQELYEEVFRSQYDMEPSIECSDANVKADESVTA